MAKYTLEFKQKVVQDYLDGKGGYQTLAKRYGVKNKAQVQNWINSYQLFGTEGLMRKRGNDIYTSQFKLNAIELYQTSEMSYREVANTLGMNNPSLIANWMRKFREEGTDGLSSTRGRPPQMPKKKKESTSENVKSVQSDQERIKELEQQVRSLQIHNAFLKELRKLRKQEANERMKQSQESSSASEDNLN